jgi:hypothetical protein
VWKRFAVPAVPRSVMNNAGEIPLGKGELPLSSDDLTHTHKVTQKLLVTKCLARRMLKNDFPNDFLNHLPG